MKHEITRRDAIRALGTSSVAAAAAMHLSGTKLSAQDAPIEPLKLKGNIKQSVSKWCFGKYPLEEFCVACKALGIQSIELLGPKDWPTLKKYGLTCAMGSGAGKGIANGFNQPELHDELIAGFEELIPQAAAAGVPSVICMSGNRKGMDDETGMKNCAEGIKRIMGLCEKHKVNFVMELLNSKVNHKDYMCDHTLWGVELCKLVGSERFGLLYDIYHMQIMEGDVIRTITDHGQYLKHYHTGGNPGRHELDETQELYYPAIMKAIVATGYDGYVGHEFVPTWDDPLEALKHGVLTCDV